MGQIQKKQHGTGKTTGKSVILPSLTGVVISGLYTNLQAASRVDSGLTPGQREAWDKMLFGGLGILLVMFLFFLFLYLRTRKRKDKNPS